MKITYSEHSKKQNLTRKIPQKYILETVNNPDKTLKSFKNRRLRQKSFGGKILEVVTVREGDLITVITQYYLEEENED